MTSLHRPQTFLSVICAVFVSGCAMDATDEDGQEEEQTVSRDDALGGLLSNGGFEKKLAGCGPGKHNAWTNCTWGGKAKHTKPSAAPNRLNGGTYGLRVKDEAQVWQTLSKGSINDGKTYTLKFLSKCVYGAQQVRFYYTDSYGTYVGGKEKYVSATHWKHHTMTLKAPKGATSATVIIDSLGGTPASNCRWDNFKLKRVD